MGKLLEKLRGKTDNIRTDVREISREDGTVYALTFSAVLHSVTINLLRISRICLLY
jgi:hypothetical protein